MTGRLTGLRNALIALIIVFAHIGIIALLVNTSYVASSPQIITASLLGSMVPAVDTQVVANDPNRPSDRRKPAAVKPKPQKESVVSRPKPVTEPVVPTNAVQTATKQTVNDGHSESDQQAVSSQQPTSASGSPQTGNGHQEKSVTEPSMSASYLQNRSPAYPSRSRELREEGRVLLRVLISAQGKAARVEIKKSSGFDRLDQAAQDAVRHWRFVPARQNGVPIDMWYDVPIEFSLKK